MKEQQKHEKYTYRNTKNTKFIKGKNKIYTRNFAETIYRFIYKHEIVLFNIMKHENTIF